jgi:subtilisin family serine protease
LEHRLVPSGAGASLQGSYDPSTLLVRFRPEAASSPATQILPGAVLKPATDLVPGLDQVVLPPGEGVADALQRYQASPLALYAEPDYLVHTADIPNDTFFSSLWGLQNTGQNVGGQTGIPGDDIQAVTAWQRITGTTTVPIADIDSGIDYTHADLYENIWINQAEIPMSRRRNLIDVDGDGLITFWDLQDPRNQGPGKIMGRNPGRIDAQDILAPMVLDGNGNDTGMGGWAHNSTQDGDTQHPDDLVGWNFVANNNRPFDDNSHGTHTAGILGAIGDTHIRHGVTGVLWKAQIAPLKFLDSSGSGTDAGSIQAINYAVRHHLPISNNSWGGGDFSQAVLDALTAARNAGHLFVAAAGNYAMNTDQSPFYPANYHLNNILSVAATDNRDQLASFSDYGATSVHLAAPGVNIYSTVPGDLYSYKSGTSMSTPFVTGVVAMIEALRPNWTFPQVINQLLGTVDPVPGLAGKTLTGGRLDAAHAVAIGATHFSVTAPAQATAGTAFAVTVRALDATNTTDPSYTGTVHFTATDGQATLPVNYTFTAADQGVHTFMATLRTAGSQTLTVTDTNTSSLTGSTMVPVNPAAASSLEIRLPANSTAGIAFDATVAVRDPYNNLVPAYRGTIRFSSNDSQASLPAAYAFTASDGGVHTFANGVTLRTAGSRTVTAADTGAGLSGNGSVVVSPAAASRLEITAPATTTAGLAISVTVAARDPYSNLVSSYRGTVTFSSDDPQATLPPSYAFTASDGGIHTFTNGITLRTAGSRSATARDAANGLSGSASLQVSPAAANHFEISAPTTSTAGAAFNLTLTARDPFNNLATGYRGTVHFTSNDHQASLPSDYAFAAADGGMHTFTNGAILRTAGSDTVTAGDSANGLTITATVLVNAAAASRFDVSTPDSSIAGAPFDLTVTARDPFGNVATGYRGTVSLTSSDGGAVLPGPYTFGSADAGVHDFPGVILVSAGVQSVTATDINAGSITGTATVGVVAAAADHFEVDIPATIPSGTPFDVTVIALDPYGNIDTQYTGTVTFTSSDPDPQVVLPADYTFTADDAGMVVFPQAATLITLGDQTITATDTITGITGSATATVVDAGSRVGAHGPGITAIRAETASASLRFAADSFHAVNPAADSWSGWPWPNDAPAIQAHRTSEEDALAFLAELLSRPA